MPARTRTKDRRKPMVGTCYYLPTGTLVASRSVNQGKIEVCDDVIGNFGGNNPFTLNIRESHWPVLNGVFLHPDTKVPWYGYFDYPCGHYSVEAPNPASDYPALTLGDRSNLAWELLAKANPNVPAVNMQQYVAELKDIPDLVKDWGGNYLRKVAKGVISWRWAVKPLHRELKTLEKFTNALNERITWLNRLREEKTIRRRVSLGNGQVYRSWTGPFPLDSGTQASRLTVMERSHCKFSMWGVANFKLHPSAVLPKPGRIADRRFATKWMTGLNSASSLSAAWELVPWSWLTDWFIGVGTVIQATNNAVPLTWGHLSVMRRSVSTKELEYAKVPANIQVSHDGNFGNSSTWIRKERYPVFPLLPFTSYLPLCDGGKWSILTALAALKLFKAKGHV